MTFWYNYTVFLGLEIEQVLVIDFQRVTHPFMLGINPTLSGYIILYNT